ncbi:MAG: hydrogenase 4 subunit F [Burkholderiales bacterium]
MEILLVLVCPLIGALLLAFVGHRPWADNLNVLFCALTFFAALFLANTIASGPLLAANGQFLADALNIFLVVLTTFVAMTTAIFSRSYLREDLVHGRLSAQRMRLFHGLYQIFIFCMLLVLLTNNMGLLWVATEAATLATVLLVSLYRTPASLEAAWKYFILCSVGIAQALFGTILLYFAAERVLGGSAGKLGTDALLWTHLTQISGSLDPTVMSIAFVFLLVGYGTKVGLVPLHNWLPDAHAEGPTPVSAVLSGLLLNVALYALLRCKVLVDGSLRSDFAGNLLMGFGLLSVLVAAFFLWRQRDIKRLFAYSSIEHMGIATFAFGLGGAVASFAGLLHMTVHSLTKSALFFSAGHAAQSAGTQVIANIRGLLRTSPAIGWGLMLGTIAILGVPPFGVFASEFLILTTAIKTQAWCAALLCIALVVAFAAMLAKVQAMVFADPGVAESMTLTPRNQLPRGTSASNTHANHEKTNSSALSRINLIFMHSPTYLHLAIVLMLGLYIPPQLADWFRQAARMLGQVT